MILLGTAQTYFGVLLTLAVLQLFYQGKNSENYFLKLMEQLGQDVLNISNLRASTFFRLYRRKINRLKVPNEMKESMIVQLSAMQTTVNASNAILKELLSLLTKDETPLFVAFYSFLFGLIVMAIDPYWSGSNFQVGFILYYITMSYAFTAALWIMYIYAPRTSRRRPITVFVKPRLKINRTFGYILFSFVVSLSLFCLMPFSSVWIRMVVTFVIFCVMGFCSRFYKTADYNRRFILRHAILIFALSLFGGFLYHINPYCSYSSFGLNDSQELFYLRLLLVLFMLGNLILIPMAIISTRHYLWKYRLNNRQRDVECQLERMIQQDKF